MTDIIEKFIEAVGNMGVGVRRTPTALLLNQCPACGGSGKYKVTFDLGSLERRGALLGSCFRGECGTGYSASKYLLMSGMSKSEVDTVLGLDYRKALFGLNPDNISEILSEGEPESDEEKEDAALQSYVAGLFDVSAWADHPAAKYAISRGLKPEHYRQVKIDVDDNSVVFLYSEGDIIRGYQKRFLIPPFKHMKTKNYAGWKAHESVLVFDRPYADVVVVEGCFTAIAGHNYGFTSACTFGAGVSYHQMTQILTVLKNKGLRKVHIAYDLDKAGEKGFDRLARFFIMEGVEVVRVIPEVGNDLSDSWTGCARYSTEIVHLNPAIPRVLI